jgi:hypothetical protein
VTYVTLGHSLYKQLMRGPAWIGVSVVAVVVGALIARDCDAPDWQQGMMFFVLPLVAGAGTGCAVWSSGTTRARLGVLLALVVAAGTALGFIVLWAAGCSR